GRGDQELAEAAGRALRLRGPFPGTHEVRPCGVDDAAGSYFWLPPVASARTARGAVLFQQNQRALAAYSRQEPGAGSRGWSGECPADLSSARGPAGRRPATTRICARE